MTISVPLMVLPYASRPTVTRSLQAYVLLAVMVALNAPPTPHVLRIHRAEVFVLSPDPHAAMAMSVPLVIVRHRTTSA